MWAVPLALLSDPIVVSEPWFNEEYDRGSRSFAEKVATMIQASKSFRLRRARRIELMDSHLWGGGGGGGVLCNCELYVPHRIEK